MFYRNADLQPNGKQNLHFRNSSVHCNNLFDFQRNTSVKADTFLVKAQVKLENK